MDGDICVGSLMHGDFSRDYWTFIVGDRVIHTGYIGRITDYIGVVTYVACPTESSGEEITNEVNLTNDGPNNWRGYAEIGKALKISKGGTRKGDQSPYKRCLRAQNRLSPFGRGYAQV